MCSSSVSKINLSWRRREVCKLLLCFAQSSYYFRIGFAMDLCQEDIKDLCFWDALGFVLEDALCTLHCPRETIVGEEAGKAWAGRVGEGSRCSAAQLRCISGLSATQGKLCCRGSPTTPNLSLSILVLSISASIFSLSWILQTSKRQENCSLDISRTFFR